MGFGTGLRALVVGSMMMCGATSTDAAVFNIEFKVLKGSWYSNPNPHGDPGEPYELPPQPELIGSFSFDDQLSGSAAFLSLDWVTGTKKWTVADIDPSSRVLFWSDGISKNFDYFDIFFSDGSNYISSSNSVFIDDGEYSMSCNNCVDATGIPQTAAVPGPIAGAGLPALMALGGFVWARRRKAAAA